MAGVIERFLHVCKIFRKNAKIVMAGPFPGLFDGRNRVLDYKSARRYVEERISAEKNFKFCRTADCFTNSDGTPANMFNDDGLTDTGAAILMSDLLDIIN